MKKLLITFLLLAFSIPALAGYTNYNKLYTDDAGTAAAPAYSWSSDPDTGFYLSAANTIGIAGGMGLSSSATASPALTLTNTNADATGNYFFLDKYSASPADNDVIGNVVFRAYDSEAATTNNVTIYSQVTVSIADETTATEDGKYLISVMKDGTLTDALSLTDGTLTLDAPTGNATLTTGNINISVIIGGMTYYLKANTDK